MGVGKCFKCVLEMDVMKVHCLKKHIQFLLNLWKLLSELIKKNEKELNLYIGNPKLDYRPFEVTDLSDLMSIKSSDYRTAWNITQITKHIFHFLSSFSIMFFSVTVLIFKKPL